MALTTGQKQGLIQRTMDLARLAGDLNKAINALDEEFTAEGGAATVINQAALDGYAPSNGLTAAEFADGVTALNNISSTVETNKTNLYKIASADSTV